jgi:hypothetical protein
MSDTPFGVGPEPPSVISMSLRDYFAGQALPAMLAINQYLAQAGHPMTNEAIAADTYAIAEAMLKAREA